MAPEFGTIISGGFNRFSRLKELSHPQKEEIELKSILYALSDPVRLELVRQLANGGEYTWASFGRRDKVKSTMTHHFKVLREAGIIKTRIEGREHFRCLRKDDLDDLFPGLIDKIVEAAGGPLVLGSVSKDS